VLSAISDLIRRSQRRRRIRLLARNARWVLEARDTPTLWTDYTGQLVDSDGEDSVRPIDDDWPG
jgi:hypothetical protein